MLSRLSLCLLQQRLAPYPLAGLWLPPLPALRPLSLRTLPLRPSSSAPTSSLSPRRPPTVSRPRRPPLSPLLALCWPPTLRVRSSLPLLLLRLSLFLVAALAPRRSPLRLSPTPLPLPQRPTSQRMTLRRVA